MISLLCSGPSEGGEAIQDWLFVLAPFGQTFIRSESKIILCNDLKDAQPCNLKVMKIVFANKIFFAEVKLVNYLTSFICPWYKSKLHCTDSSTI